jgi:hypothetical protein
MKAKDVVAGLTVLLKYEPEAEIDAQHDQLFASSVDPEKVKDDDCDTLLRHKWLWDPKLESWYCFT